jgi:chemotaxis protein CheY-P-specific phosphatase CheC
MFFLIQETPSEDQNIELKYAVNIKDPKVDIIMLFCEETAYSMAENFLGTDEIEDSDIVDTLKECINIIAGNIIGNELMEYTTRVNIPSMLDIATIDKSTFEKAVLFYNEKPVEILLKLG